MDDLKEVWLWMLEPPWRHSGPETEQGVHWLYWLVGWAWTIAGLLLGALVAPSLVQRVGLANTSYSSYQDWLVIAVAVLAGVLVQLLGAGLIFLLGVVSAVHSDAWRTKPNWVYILFSLLFTVVALLPFAGVGYGIYRYFTWIGVGQRSVTIAFVGGLLIKTFAIPLIKGIVAGALFRWFMKWLHGAKDKQRA